MTTPSAAARVAPPGLPPAPARLPRPGETVPFGRYSGEIADVDTTAWDASTRRRRFERKAWFFLGAYSESHSLGFAVADAGYAATAFAYAHDRRTGEYVEEKALAPFHFPGGFQPSLRGEWAMARGGRSWRVAPKAGGGWQATFIGERLHLALDAEEDAAPVSVVAPAAGRPFNATTKLAGVSVAAQVKLYERPSVTVAGLGVLDFTKGYPPRHTFWNWAGLVGRAESGEAVGLNLGSGFNDGMANAVWTAGGPRAVGQCAFSYDAADVHKPWRVASLDGAVELDFAPDGAREETVNLGAFRNRFQQPFGRWTGVLRLDGGEARVAGFGVVEQHWATW